MFAPETTARAFGGDGWSRASMRPGHVCPGNRGPARNGLATWKRFNEAGACLPRKPVRVAPARAAPTGFNEAGACLPRKPQLQMQRTCNFS